ncbi:sigma 54-interacting transcriptional regulator [Clostridium diolis]|uniref:ATPase AAA n=1 Tax=Clostridium diolis TaxID=223919 RepID=A0AAV3VXQ1_9CLOT|nr:sigma-54-dependent transcriptional regulator [Clostridium diolis]QES72200.1 PRD domain-containing protein [Clostridium diolis]GEA30181.1 ATPase AAA [Clostridium diolis]
MRRIDNIYKVLRDLCSKEYNERRCINGFSATEISLIMNIQRTNVSSDLNKLYRDGKIEKILKKPVLYKIKAEDIQIEQCIEKVLKDAFDNIIGTSFSLKNSSQQARAAIIYPPNGLHTLLLGETGTGKSMFAEVMYKYAKEIGKIKANAQFISFNCADYANNPQLLVSHIFGVKKGAYTGASRDTIGLVEKANEGILFLDEVHRLPSEGQEMLFSIIDKGIYRRLGDSEEEYKVKLLIICATTENVESALLKTFTRRIPMIIRLPALKDRTIEERYELIKNFLKIEVSCIKQSIGITANALKAFLLYNCSNNIGQLKSDIKLSCSKAFLENMMKRDKNICIHSQYLPQYVLSGLFKYKEKRNEIDRFVNQDVIKFCLDENNVREEEDIKIVDFYGALEEKRKLLESNGISEKDIKLIMSLDIDTYFKKYILNIDKDNLEELYKVVDRKIVDLVSEFLNKASEKLLMQFDSKILYGLSMHVASTVERILKGKEIKNHQLEDIKKMHPREYEISYDLKEKVESTFHIRIPEDEVGFITMFLCIDKEDYENESSVGIIVAMHGEYTASSMADVANRLLGEKYAIGYDMPLDQKPETALENLTEIVKEIDKGRGVLLLVDMGSLVLFGDMIYEKTKVPVKTIEMVSTPIVLEATRKATLKASLEEIYDCCINLNPHIVRSYADNFSINSTLKKKVIITACITGQGTAIKLKPIVEEKLEITSNDIDILNIDIVNKKKFNHNIQKIKAEKDILAVVSAVKPDDESLLYISTSDIFDKKKVELLKSRLNLIEEIYDMREVIGENVNIDSYKYIECFRSFYIRLVNNKVELNSSALIGLILHIACVIERMLSGEKIIYRKYSEKMLDENKDKYNFVREILKPMEEAFNIEISVKEYLIILETIYFL